MGGLLHLPSPIPFHDLLAIIIHFTFDSIAILGNFLLFLAIVFRSPASLRSCGVLLVNCALVDLLAALNSKLIIPRLIRVGEVFAYAYDGACVAFSSQFCHCLYTIMLACYAQSLFPIATSFAFKLYALEKKSPRPTQVLSLCLIISIPNMILLMTFMYTLDDHTEVRAALKELRPEYDLDDYLVAGHLSIFTPRVHNHCDDCSERAYFIDYIHTPSQARIREKTSDMSVKTTKLHTPFTKTASVVPLFAPFITLYYVQPYRAFVEENLFCRNPRKITSVDSIALIRKDRVVQARVSNQLQNIKGRDSFQAMRIPVMISFLCVLLTIGCFSVSAHSHHHHQNPDQDLEEFAESRIAQELEHHARFDHEMQKLIESEQERERFARIKRRMEEEQERETEGGLRYLSGHEREYLRELEEEREREMQGISEHDARRDRGESERDNDEERISSEQEVNSTAHPARGVMRMPDDVVQAVTPEDESVKEHISDEKSRIDYDGKDVRDGPLNMLKIHLRRLEEELAEREREIQDQRDGSLLDFLSRRRRSHCEHGRLRGHFNPRKFMRCENGSWIVSNTPPGMEFDFVHKAFVKRGTIYSHFEN